MMAIGLTATALMLCMCSDDSSGPGRVQVYWQVANTTCTKAGITDVWVHLSQGQERLLSRSTHCSAGTVLIDDVPAGVYDILVEGHDKDDAITYEGSYLGLDVEEGEVASSPPGKIMLSLKSGTLLLNWKLVNTSSNICGFNNVAQVEVNVSQNTPLLNLFSGVFPCDPSSADPDTLPAPLVNAWIEIGGMPPTDLDVVLFGLSPEGVRLFQGDETVPMPIGGETQVSIELAPCQGECV